MDKVEAWKGGYGVCKYNRANVREEAEDITRVQFACKW